MYSYIYIIHIYIYYYTNNLNAAWECRKCVHGNFSNDVQIAFVRLRAATRGGGGERVPRAYSRATHTPVYRAIVSSDARLDRSDGYPDRADTVDGRMQSRGIRTDLVAPYARCTPPALDIILCGRDSTIRGIVELHRGGDHAADEKSRSSRSSPVQSSRNLCLYKLNIFFVL